MVESTVKSRVMHIDLDAFFASCEEAKDPSLKNRPVIIGADPKEGKGRGVVSTANYAARKFGVRSALPISIAYRRCPHGVFLFPDFSLYSNISSSFFSFISSLGFPFQQASVDEGYLELGVISDRDLKLLCGRIKKFLFEEHRITCSMGIGPNKLVAKVASDYKKPNGVTIVTDVLGFLSPLSVKKIPGIGPKTSEWLKKLNVVLLADLQKLSKEQLVENFGVSRGEWLFRASRGISSSKVSNSWVRKSIGAERTFMEDVDDKELVNSKVDELIEKIFVRMKDKSFSSKTLVLKIRYEDFETHTAQRSGISHFSSSSEAKSVGRNILRPFLNKKKIRLVGARFVNLSRKL